MARIYNFSAGPCTLPLPVLEAVQADMTDYQGSGMSLIEQSHRGKQYDAVHMACMELFHTVLGVPKDFKVLFMGGGASTQFAMVPMNFIPRTPEVGSADYVVTGSWSQKAIKEAKIVANAREAASSKASNFDHIPTDLDRDANAAYLHITTNNTIFGTQWQSDPQRGTTPLVADMSSDIMSRPVDFSQYDLIYAGAQKNLGPAGVTVALVKESYLATAKPQEEAIPTMLRYSTHAENDSLYNTPPVFAIYVMKLVLEWVRDNGGLDGMAKLAAARAKAIYDAVDASGGYYKGTVKPDSRSKMNATFRLPSEDLEKTFIAQATKAGFDGLKGHRSVGGVRVSMYNAMPVEGCTKLAQFMADFAKANPA